MLLDKKAIKQKAIVSSPSPTSERETTYDATVGEIILKGVVQSGESFILQPRGVVWVISKEEFTLPLDVTGLATLRTTWTHDGMLALNVGVIDPGWKGPVATALVNLSVTPFLVKKGDPFFRVLFHGHDAATTAPQTPANRAAYVNGICEKSLKFSETFLNMKSLVDEVADKVLAFPKWANIIAIVALSVTIAAIFVPICIQVWTEHRSAAERITKLEAEVDSLKNDDASKAAPLQAPSMEKGTQRQPTVTKTGKHG
jgi:deoxycytidine triphosphate deaminase